MTEAAPATVPPVGLGTPPLARSMVAMTVLTAISRVTGFVLFVVVAAVLGYGYLANTYQTANTIPNVVYELVVAGVVQAVLIPSLVSRLDRGEQREAEHVAGAVLGLATVCLGVVALVGVVVAPWIARILFSGGDPALHHQQVRTGTILLRFFLPQVVLYAAGLVATSVLNARHRFALPAVAPLANNVVVIAACLVYARVRNGPSSSLLGLRGGELAVLGIGTTLGVVAFCGLPVVAVLRSDFRLRPNLDRAHPEVRRLARHGAWAAAFLAATQLLLVTVLILGNRVPGGVIAYQLAFQFFLLPHALFALPVVTTLFPTMSRQHHDADTDGLGASLGRGVSTIAYLVAPTAALLGALGGVISRTLQFGHAGPRGASLVAGCLVGFAPGLLGYGLFLFASRVSYARGDTRTPALVNAGVVVAGSGAMVLGFVVAPEQHRMAAVALAHSLAYLAGAAVLLSRVVRSLPVGDRPALAASLGRPVLLSVALAGVVAVLAHAIDPSGRAAGLAVVALLAAVGLGSYALASQAAGGPAPSGLLAGLRVAR